MNIHNVRARFQESWDFIVLTNYLADLSTCRYSLQQGSLNSDDMLLYVTSQFVPKLEGHLIEAKNQKWIVYQRIKEVVNHSLYEYRLFPAIDTFELIEVVTVKNSIGTKVMSEKAPITMHCFIEERSAKERAVPTVQVVESYQQTFIVAQEELPDYRGDYLLRYKGVKYKIDSFELLFGGLRIRATENL